MELIRVGQAGRQVIERYGPRGFRISGATYGMPVLVFPDRTIDWIGASVSAEALSPVVNDGSVELLLLGLGRRTAPVPASLRTALKAHGIAVEAMDTGAACRTFNVLLGEDRRVAAALLLPV